MNEESIIQDDIFLNGLFDAMPESKFELIDGRFIVGNGLAGSRLLLQQLLHGWGLESAVALGSIEIWVEALCEIYNLPSLEDFASLESLERRAAAVDYRYPDCSAGREGDNAGNWQMRQHLLMSMHTASRALGGQSLGRDFCMKIGEDGFSPDFLYFREDRRHRLFNYYLDGPADLVMEVVLPAHRIADREMKREWYARGGVPEYAIISPNERSIEFLRLSGGEYRTMMPDADGKYRPASVPGLAIAVEELWVDKNGWEMDKQPFLVERATREGDLGGKVRSNKNGWGWGARPFAPKLSRWPESIGFADFISWCPEAKIEFWDDRPQICGREGVRSVIGMLLATFGLAEACRLAPPLAWVAAVKSSQEREARSREIKDHWWRKSREVAAMLRDRFNLRELAVTGDLLSHKPINYWSELSLAIHDLNRAESYKVYEALLPYHDETTPRINFFDAEDSYFKKRVKVSGWNLENI